MVDCFFGLAKIKNLKYKLRPYNKISLLAFCFKESANAARAFSFS
jgi:hypothetical protein